MSLIELFDIHDEELPEISMDKTELDRFLKEFSVKLTKSKFFLRRKMQQQIQKLEKKFKNKRMENKIAAKKAMITQIDSANVKYLAKCLLHEFKLRNSSVQNEAEPQSSSTSISSDKISNQQKKLLTQQLLALPTINEFLIAFKRDHLHDWAELIDFCLYQNTGGHYKSSEQKARHKLARLHNVPLVGNGEVPLEEHSQQEEEIKLNGRRVEDRKQPKSQILSSRLEAAKPEKKKRKREIDEGIVTSQHEEQNKKTEKRISKLKNKTKEKENVQEECTKKMGENADEEEQEKQFEPPRKLSRKSSSSHKNREKLSKTEKRAPQGQCEEIDIMNFDDFKENNCDEKKKYLADDEKYSPIKRPKFHQK